MSERTEGLSSSSSRSQQEPSEVTGDQPVLRVVKGDPTPGELVALVSVVLARQRSAAGGAEPTAPKSEWAANHRKLRTTRRPGPGAWRAAGWSR